RRQVVAWRRASLPRRDRQPALRRGDQRLPRHRRRRSRAGTAPGFRGDRDGEEVERETLIERRPEPRAVLALALLSVLPGLDHAQKDKKDKRPNDPTTCTVCHGDPALMKAGGIVSHGGYDFGKNNTQKADEFLVNCDIRWIETEHL